jgi:hypothetical protein
LLVSGQTAAIQTTTRDVSSCGFYYWTRVQLMPGERIVGILKVPAYSREWPDSLLSLECQVRVARVDPRNQEGFYGLGCEISNYRLLRV